MTSYNTIAINNSSSKQRFSFAKNARFEKIKSPTKVGCYDVKDEFAIPKQSGSGKAFGSIDRFGYYEKPSTMRLGKAPSPDQYKIKGSFGEDVVGGTVNGPNKEYSFGVSRDDPMKKGYKKILSPGPGNYALAPTFGKDGQFKTFSSKYYYDT